MSLYIITCANSEHCDVWECIISLHVVSNQIFSAERYHCKWLYRELYSDQKTRSETSAFSGTTYAIADLQNASTWRSIDMIDMSDEDTRWDATTGDARGPSLRGALRLLNFWSTNLSGIHRSSVSHICVCYDRVWVSHITNISVKTGCAKKYVQRYIKSTSANTDATCRTAGRAPQRCSFIWKDDEFAVKRPEDNFN